MTNHTEKTALVTGANSGLGFEAAAQLAESGYGSVTIACRSQAKADAARSELASRTGSDVFDTLAVDVASIESSTAAAAELQSRARPYDLLLLNAGMVPSKLNLTADGVEACFAASIIGHHIIAKSLLEANLLENGTVVMVGSEAANNDLPKALGMSVYDFVLGEASVFGSPPALAMKNFATATGGPDYNGQRQYASTKAFSAWWSAAMARRYPGSTTFFTVSPGSNMGTNAARHIEGIFKVMVGFMARFGRFMGMDQPVADGAKRYLDVAHGIGGPYENGRTYTSKPKKMTGPLYVCEQSHLNDAGRQDLALEIIEELTDR